MNIQQSGDTIVAPATAQGQGAIAIIRLSGPDALTFTQSVFKGDNLSGADSHTLHYGKILDGEETLDEVVVSVYKNPTSYTGEDIIEISCHASPYIVQRLLTILLQAGARMAEPGEFSMRAYLNGKMDLSQAEAVADLIASESAAQHKLAMNQLRGRYSSEIQDLRDKLIHFASMIELENDFAEEDVEFADREELLKLIDEILKKMDFFIESFSYGNVIKKGIPVVLIGPPNSGKSTLLNSLLKEDKAIVSDIAGTTRDVIEDTIHVDGILYRFIDTAGIRDTEDKLESMGIERTRKKIAEASLLLILDDVTSPYKEIVERVKKIPLADYQDRLVLLNKMDLMENDCTAYDVEEAVSTMLNRSDVVAISATENQGIDKITSWVSQQVQGNKFHAADTIVSNARHHSAFLRAHYNLEQARHGLYQNIPSDLVAIDIRHASLMLNEILGEIQTDDLLENIFRNFCIGK